MPRASKPPPYRSAKRAFERAYAQSVIAYCEANGLTIGDAAKIAGKERRDFYELCYRAGVMRKGAR